MSAVPFSKLPSAIHHWWPKALSRHWADGLGRVFQVFADGSFTWGTPKAFGGIRDHNNIELSDSPSPWDHSFEGEFSQADGGFTPVISWLKAVASASGVGPESLEERLSALSFPPNTRTQLAECLASLIVRSPSFRHRVGLGIEDLQKAIGLRTFNASNALIGMNVRHTQRELASAIASRGKFAVLLAGDREFVFGDGFLHTVSSGNGVSLGLRCLIPITPEIAVFYTRPDAYRDGPSVFSMALASREVELVNWMVQVYSKDFLFFREIHPVLTPEFRGGQHLEFEGHKHPWTENLEKAMVQFRVA